MGTLTTCTSQLIFQFADLDPGSGAFLAPGSGIRKKIQNQDPGSEMNIRDLIFVNLVYFLVLKHLNSLIRIRDLVNLDLGSGMEKIGSGIRDKHPGSATLSFSRGVKYDPVKEGFHQGHTVCIALSKLSPPFPSGSHVTLKKVSDVAQGHNEVVVNIRSQRSAG
jgi:hypothetical protein